MRLDDATVNELAECVRKNHGLRKAISKRGLDVSETLAYLRANHRELFRQAKAGESPPDAPAEPPVIAPPSEPAPPKVFTIDGTVKQTDEGMQEYALIVKEAAP